MEREKLVRELMFHLRLGEDSSIEFKAVVFDGNKIKSPNRDSIAREEAGRQALIERRGEGVPKIINASKALSGKEPEYRIVDDAELLLTIYAASKDSE